MTKADMATLTGLFLRNGVWQLRVVVPNDVRPAYNGRVKIDQSLGTSARREAVLLGTEERAKLLAEFELHRQALNPQRLDTVTPEMASELAQRVRARVLHLDESAREDPKIRVALREINALIGRSSLEHLTIAGHLRLTAPIDSLAGLSPEEAQTLAGLNDIMNKDAGVKLAQRRLSAVLPLVQKEAQYLGLTFDHTAPGGREALQAALKAYRQAWQEVTQRDAGEVIDTPVVTAIAKAALKPSKLRDVYARWTGSKPRTQDTINACLRSVVLFEEFTGNTPITQLTREQGDGFRAWLQHPDRKTTSKTARDRLVWVKSLLKYACRDLELISRNPHGPSTGRAHAVHGCHAIHLLHDSTG
jgi:hypothetical protein